MRFLTACFAVLCFFTFDPEARAASFAITVDDPGVGDAPTMRATEIDARIRATLERAGLRAALFVCGMRVDSLAGRRLLGAWSKDGHLLGNHTYSHRYFHDASMTLDDLIFDTLAGERVIAGLPGFRKLFRFPFLKEGNTPTKRDGMRKFFRQHGYQHAGVSIDASDWYVSQRLEQRLARDPKADLTPYRTFYLAHILERTRFYDDLARRVLGRSVRHTLLVHHNLLNAIFLGDLIAHLEAHGFSAIDADDAFQDDIYSAEPPIIPAGESVIWGLAKATGRFEAELRYPGEDSRYEEEAMDAAGL